MGSEEDERKNSEFLDLMKKLNNKEIVLQEKDNTLVENKHLKNEILQKPKENVDKLFQNIWSEINQKYNQNDGEDMIIPNESKFTQKENPYLTDKKYENTDLIELAKKLISEAKSQEALVVLEAECQKNEDNSEAWVLLGKIHSENDCDHYALQCLLKALEVDSFNLEAELYLGILCTNEFDSLDAMIHLKNWVKLHPQYSKFLDENDILLNYNIIKEAERNDIEGEDIELKARRIEKMKNNFYIQMGHLLETIYKQFSNDSDLLCAMGICHFIPSNNLRSMECFRKAVETNYKDYNAWNKLGAIYAHSKLHEDAVYCYKKAVELKPDYVRCWANLGIAYFNVDNYEEAIHSYLKALKIIPSNHQIWSYLSSVLNVSKKYDLIKLVNQRQLDELLKIFKI